MAKRYKTPEQMDKVVDDYVATCQINDEPLTLTGLALHLGFASREALNYYTKFPEFVDSVKRARTLVEHQYEKNLSNRGTSPVGSIFALKNFGWKDKYEVDPSDDFVDALFELVDKNKNKGEEEE